MCNLRSFKPFNEGLTFGIWTSSYLCKQPKIIQRIGIIFSSSISTVVMSAKDFTLFNGIIPFVTKYGTTPSFPGGSVSFIMPNHFRGKK